MRLARITTALAALLAAALIVPAAANVPPQGLTQLAGTAGCINTSGASNAGNDTCGTARAIVGAFSIAVSPDGAHAYVAAQISDALAIFDRDAAADGALTQKAGTAGCISDTGQSDPDNAATAGECTDGRALNIAASVDISPDGENVYVASIRGGLAVFDRDPATGMLTQKAGVEGCVSGDGSSDEGAGTCTVGRAVSFGRNVVVSPDGRNVYLTSDDLDAIAIFDRDPDTGALTQKAGTAGCVSETGRADGSPATAGSCANGRLLERPRALTLTMDGTSLYLAAEGSGANDPDGVAVFDRDPDTGELTQKGGTAGCHSENGSSRDGAGTCTDATALTDPQGVGASPDGESVYVTSRRAPGFAVFDRDTTTGALAQKAGTDGCVSERTRSDDTNAATAGACSDGKLLTFPDDVVATNAGVYVHTGSTSGGLAMFERAADGGVQQLPQFDACLSEDGFVPFVFPEELCGSGKSLAGTGGLAMDPAQANLYMATFGGMAAFAIGRRPVITRSDEGIAFGEQRVGTDSASRRVTIGNTGDLALGFLSIQVENNTHFRIAATTCDLDTPVPPGGSCDVDLVFGPTATGDHASRLVVRSNDSDFSPLFVDLTGTGTEEGDPLGPQVEFNPPAIDFGNQETGTRSISEVIDVRNVGDANLEVETVELAGANPGDFDVVLDDCTGETVAPGTDCEMEVAFTPGSAGAKDAVLDVPTNDASGPREVPLEGTGTEPPAEDPPGEDPPGEDPPAGGGSQPAPQLPASGAPPTPAPGSPQTPAAPSGAPTLEVSRGVLSYRSDLTISGSAGPGERVTIESQRAGSRRSQAAWSLLRRVEADASGRFSTTVRVGNTRLYRVRTAQGESSAKRVRVRPRIAMLVRGARSIRGGRAHAAQAGQALRLPLRVTPMKRRVAIRIERLVNGRYRLVTRRVRRTKRGRATVTVRLAEPGTYRIRVISFGDRRHAAGRSHSRTIEIE